MEGEAARAAARPLASEGAKLYQAGQYVNALDLFLRADALYSTPQYRVYKPRNYGKLGKIVNAVRAYEEAIGLALPVNAAPSFHDAQSTAAAELKEIRRRLATLQVVLVGPLADEVRVTIDGAMVDAAEITKKDLDPGVHLVVATAEGFNEVKQSIELREGSVERVELVLQRSSTEVSAKASSTAGRQSKSVLSASPRGDSPSPTDLVRKSSLSHRQQAGAFARADIDPVYGGMVAAAGLSYGLIDRLEVTTAFLGGRDVGIEPGLTFFVLTNEWKPLINAGVPLFFVDGALDDAHAGVRGAVGLQWDPIRPMGFFVQVGGAYFWAAPEGYAKGIFMPSAGVQARL